MSEASAPSLEARQAGLLRLLPWLASGLVFVGFCVADAVVWEPAHDEGVTWTQAFGAPELASCGAATSASDLTLSLDGGQDRSLADVVAALVKDGMHPPAYYLLVHSWASLVGTQRIALSVPAMALGILSLLAMGGLARSLAPGRASGVWAMMLLACSPWFVGYSVFARPYGLVLFASLWSTLALLEMQSCESVAGGRRLRWRVIFVLASCLGLYSLYHYAFVLLWQGVVLAVLAWRSGERRGAEIAALAVMAAAIVCGYAPWLPSLGVHLAAVADSPYYFSGWLSLADWPAQWGHLLLVFALGEGLWSTSAGMLRPAAVVLGICTLPLALRSLAASRLGSLAPPARLLWIAAPLLPLLILLSDWLRETHTLFISKTAFSFLPLLILLVVRAWQSLPRRSVAVAGLSACVLLCAAASWSAIQTRGRFLTSFEVVAEYLRRSDTAAHQVVLSSDRRGYTIPLLLTLRDAGVRAARVSLAPANQLIACVDSLLSDPATERVTLVDFKVPYQEQEKWGASRLEDVARRARSRGWRDVRLAAGDKQVAVRAGRERFWNRYLAVEPTHPRVLVIASPVEAKYFSE